MQFYTFYIQGFYESTQKNNNKIKMSEPFKGLFTQGMVCHETYKDEKGKWLSLMKSKRDQVVTL